MVRCLGNKRRCLGNGRVGFLRITGFINIGQSCTTPKRTYLKPPFNTKLVSRKLQTLRFLQTLCLRSLKRSPMRSSILSYRRGCTAKICDFQLRKTLTYAKHYIASAIVHHTQVYKTSFQDEAGVEEVTRWTLTFFHNS